MTDDHDGDADAWTDHVPGWLITARKLAFAVVGAGLLVTVGGIALGERVGVAAGMAVLAVPLVGIGVVDLLRPEWGHHAGFRRYHEPTADPPDDDQRRKVRINGVVILVAAATLLGWFATIALQ